MTLPSKTRRYLQLFLQFLDAHYYIIFGLASFGLAVGSVFNKHAHFDDTFFVLILGCAALTVGKEIKRDVKWAPYLLTCLPILLAVYLLNNYGYVLWGKMLNYELTRSIVVDLNKTFALIPFNDAAFTRVFRPDWLTKFMQFVYQNGFVLPVMLPIIRAAFAKDMRKILRYMLSGHVIQIFLITPFYLIFHLQEVWYVLGHPDGMARNLTPEAAAGVTINCLPSMHTSIAFAMFLVALAEKSRLFKVGWGFFCLSIIFSTMYLEIHWVIDVIAGLLLGWGTVKLVDFSLKKASKYIPNVIRNCYVANHTNQGYYDLG